MVTIDQLLYEEDEDFNGVTTVNSGRSNYDTDQYCRQLLNTNTLIHALPTTTRAQSSKSSHDVVLQKARQRNNLYRKRRKIELTALRDQEAKLRQLLATLHQHKNREQAQGGPRDAVSLAAWKAVAVRQHEKRLESIALQNLLQTAVNYQALVIQDLQHALKKRLRDESKLTVQDILGSKSALDMKDAMFYKAYFDSLPVLYGKLDEIFDEVGLNPSQEKVFAGEPKREMEGEMEYFEKS